MNRRGLRGGQKGFTIVELLIATAVFGVVLLFVTVAILQFTRVYYKGITENSTQEAARNIVDRISQSIQFNGGGVTETPARVAGAARAFCVGSSQQFSYVIGYQLTEGTLGPSQTRRSLVASDSPGCNSSTSPVDMTNVTAPGRELLTPNMRLAKMEIQHQGGSLYRISVRVVYGDNDLLNNPTGDNASCRSQRGSQFCAVSDITTVVIKRIE